LPERREITTGQAVAGEYMHCMEVFGGSQLTERAVTFGGLDTWLFSKPHGDSRVGGDVYYASSCINGRISRFLLADIVGHGEAAAETADGLKALMRRYVNWLDHSEFVRRLNRRFAAVAPEGVFATAIVATFFAPTQRLCLCNAGHPPPLLYRAASREWSLLGVDEAVTPRNMPLGIGDLLDYRHFDVELESGDCLLVYSDALMEACGQDRKILGEDGLLEIARGLNAYKPKDVAESLLHEIAERYPAALSCDDVTVMVLQANGRGLQFPLREKWGVAKIYFSALFTALRTGSQKPVFPYPGWHLANLGGSIIPVLSKLWRARS
jgi:serine phosphatase RsbU (regulator of sigma subunit)